MRKVALLLLFLPLFLHAGSDFDLLMGKGLKCWKHVKTKEDRQTLEMLKGRYERNILMAPAALLIPEVIHVVWLGPREFPEGSRENVKSWVRFHPGWRVKFWTDRPRSVPCPEVEVNVFDPAYLGEYRDLYEESDNWGEKSDILRLVVLQKEGGLYVDHDAVCRKSFAELHKTYDFYTSLLFPGKFALDSAIVIRNSIVGVRPDHEVLSVALGLIRKRWKEVGDAYPGKDFDSVEKRVIQRSFAGFHYAVLETLQDPSFAGIVFPAGYFTECDKKFGIYAHEEISGSWYRGEMTYHEKLLKERVHQLMIRLHWFMALSGLLIAVNLLLTIYVLKRVLPKGLPRRS